MVKEESPVLAALEEAREEVGKETKDVNFMSESKLCNWAVTGKFEKIDEKALSNEDAALLEKVRRRNESFLVVGMDYKERKARLFAYAMKTRTKLLS